ncbi:unnamed protein product [Prunus armeniaca]
MRKSVKTRTIFCVFRWLLVVVTAELDRTWKRKRRWFDWVRSRRPEWRVAVVMEL